jgi:hypothetical protein
MATYKLSKNLDGSNVKLYKDGVELSLYTNIYNTGVTEHGWGGWKGNPEQLAFALAYDVSQNVEVATQRFEKVAAVFSHAAPMELEISTGTIQLALRS